MKIVQINAVCSKGSTGKICASVSRLLDERNIENYVFYTSGESNLPAGRKYASDLYIKLSALKSRVFGNYGFNSASATKKLILELEEIKPDIVHLHNLHSHNCNLPLLFNYFKKNKTKLLWTFHDCWAFTAYCPYFTAAKCDKWKTQCRQCPQKRGFSWVADRSEVLYRRKKELFSGLDLTVITPSEWLSELTHQSFLGEYPVKVINNGIELEVFKPTDSDFRSKYGCENDFLLLGVAFDWGYRKGLDVFCELASRLPEGFKIVLVGTNDEIDVQLPKNIISIHRTENQTELAKIYSAADLFVNPTREENYPTVNMESVACGTPVLTFRTGGSPEMLDARCGVCIDCDDVDGLAEQIIRIARERPFTTEGCLEKSAEFSADLKFAEYVKLYENIGNVDQK